MMRLLVLTALVFMAQGYQGYDDDSIPDYETYPVSDDVTYLDDMEIDSSRNAMFLRSRLWQHGKIPVVIDKKYPSVVKQVILDAMREIEFNVNSPGEADCIRFANRSYEKDYIHILPRGRTCGSPVGRTRSGRQDLSIGRGCEHRGVVMHELTHAIGFFHEIGRPDRDAHVNINMSNVLAGHEGNYRLYPHALTLNTAYDYTSLMHYSVYTFAADGRTPVITPKGQLPEGAKLGQRLQHSQNDVLKIQKLYQCKQDTSHVRQREVLSAGSCDFAHGFCEFTQDSRDNFRWVVQNGSSATGPGTGDTSGNDNYAIATASGPGLHISRHYTSARLTTGELTESTFCLDLSVFNYGSDGVLKVVGKPATPGHPPFPVETYHPLEKMAWKNVIKTVYVLPKYPHYQIVFEAKVKKSDIAIDNVLIYKGPCM